MTPRAATLELCRVYWPVKEAGPIKIGLVPAATEEEETASHGVDDDDEESRRERHLALIIADWRQRKDGAEPSAEELKQMSGC